MSSKHKTIIVYDKYGNKAKVHGANGRTEAIMKLKNYGLMPVYKSDPMDAFAKLVLAIILLVIISAFIIY